MLKIVTLILLAIGLVVGREVNQVGLDLIKKFDTFHPDFFVNPNGVKLIGYGHSCSANDCTKIFAPITEAVGEQLLKADLAKAESCVQQQLEFVTDNQFSALVSLVSQIGCNAFQASTLSAELLAKDFTDAANQFSTFVHGNKGQVDPELVKRRAAEKDLFLK